MRSLTRRSIAFGCMCLCIALFLMGGNQGFAVQINNSQCAELDIVVATLMEDPLVQQYANDNCSVVELLVKREIVGTREYKCVKGFKDGDCVLPSFVQNDIINGTTDILEDLIVAQDSFLVDTVQASPDTTYIPPVITYTPPRPTIATPKITNTPTPAVANTAPTVTIPTYAPTPALVSNGIVYDPDFSHQSDFDQFISVALNSTSDSTNEANDNIFEVSSTDTVDLKSSLSQYANANTATSSQKNSLIGFLQGIIGGESDANEIERLEDASTPTEAKTTVLVDLPEELQDRVIDKEFFVFTDDAVHDDSLEAVKNSLMQKYGTNIEYIEPIFQDSALTKDFVVKLKDTNEYTYLDVAAYLDTKEGFIATTNLQAGVKFGHSGYAPIGAGFSLEGIKNRFSGDENSFSVQSISDNELEQRHLEYVGYNDIAACIKPGRSVKVAIVDNGFDILHEDINGKIVAMYDEADKDNDVQVPNYKPEWNHGIKEAGLVGAEHNDIGVNGIFGDSELILVKSTKDKANGKDITNGIEAIAKAYELGADVINLSRGGFGNVPILEKVTKAVAAEGVYLVAAAGNYNKSEMFYPAAYEWVISVAAIDENGAKANFSNYGPWVDIAAPGVDMLTTDLDNTYDTFNGTSEASPLVAGALGLALSYGLDWDDIKDNVFPTRNDNLGAGILDVRFMCDLIPDEVPLDTMQTHGSGSEGFLDRINGSTLIMILGGALVVLGILGGLMSMLYTKKQR